MPIEQNKVVSFEYTLKDDKGEVLDRAEAGDPFDYLHGSGMIVPGLESALAGKDVGDALSVSLTAEQAYGQRDESLIRRIPLRKLRDKNPQVGRRYPAEIGRGVQLVLVKSIEGDYATVDPNHPLAGMALNFDVKIAKIRDATAEELEHGHIHGADGHHHH